ncbi:MAG: M48 family metallopeptidase [Clostridiaceae bacterium]|nr:M48 family metallopeptidase [Clostridiaceae bacterium]
MNKSMRFKSDLIKINLENESRKTIELECELIFSYRKTLSLQVIAINRIKIRAPQKCSKRYILDFVRSKSNWILKHLNRMKDIVPAVPLNDEEISFGKKETLKRVQVFLATYKGLHPKRITIRHQKTRWGSCSSKGNISLNLNCGFIPQELFEYVMVHELAHLYEMNHSSTFWSIVESYLPNYKQLRKELKKYPLR